jgi:hypothetical protein
MKRSFYKKLGCIITALVLITTIVTTSTQYTHAGGVGGGSTLGMQIVQQAELAVSAVQNTITAANTGITAGATAGLLNKELLDGIAWAVAKQLMSQMTQSLVNWINSGFQGSPAFITDLNGFLIDALDTAAGQYISSLGGVGEFICSPFRLDIQVALSVSYQQARSGMPSGPTAPACRLSDIENNIEDFFSGVSDGGWEEWLSITSNPQNTPYGAYLAAEAELDIRLRNQAGQEIEIASWSDGFMSKRVCEAIEGKPSGFGANCKITTPGKVISEALTFQLSTGQRTLIEADEINEIIGALISQLTLQAMRGINGLLGLGGNDAYADNSFGSSGGSSYIDAAREESDNTFIDTSSIKVQMDAALAREQQYLTLIDTTIARATSELRSRGLGPTGARIATSSTTIGDYDTPSSALVNLISNATAIRPGVQSNIVTLTSLVTTYNTADAAGSSVRPAGEIRQDAALDYIELSTSGTLTSEGELAAKRTEWARLFP